MENNFQEAKVLHLPPLDEDVKKSFKIFDIGVIQDNYNCSSKTNLMDEIEEEKSVIVIVNNKLGNEVCLWLTLGQCVQHITLATALGAMICATGVNENMMKIAKPLAVSSVAMSIGHYLIWHQKPLNQYRVAQGQSIKSWLKDTQEPSVTIIVRKVVPCFTRVMHTFASAMALAVTFWPDIKSLRIKENLGSILNRKPEVPNISENVKDIFNR
ncbi:uncharacterized protein NPIL_531321 [Nephila pilipes]|uniref:Transmembrane protein n=1 Tax=Nephila pilipes TaxID=299642 RepID=A0A8X6NG33_NEPPI|nr:uncharacterized protein NPIL_531321 [Nephila pilipes]